MTQFSYPTMFTMAHALLERRATAAKYVQYWEKSKRDPHAPSLHAAIRAELLAADAALREQQAVAPPFLRSFLSQQIDLIQQVSPIKQPSAQEAP